MTRVGAAMRWGCVFILGAVFGALWTIITTHGITLGKGAGATAACTRLLESSAVQGESSPARCFASCMATDTEGGTATARPTVSTAAPTQGTRAPPPKVSDEHGAQDAVPLANEQKRVCAARVASSQEEGNAWDALVDENCGALPPCNASTSASREPRIHFAVLTTNFSLANQPARRENVERITKEFPFFEVDVGLRGDTDLDEINDVLNAHGMGCEAYPRDGGESWQGKAFRLGRLALWATTMKQWSALVKQRDK